MTGDQGNQVAQQAVAQLRANANKTRMITGILAVVVLAGVFIIYAIAGSQSSSTSTDQPVDTTSQAAQE